METIQETPPDFTLDKIINIPSLKENDVVVFKVGQEMTEQMAFTLMSFAQRYSKDLRAKNITVLCLNSDQSIEVLPEEQLNKMGWYKKGLIIT